MTPIEQLAAARLNVVGPYLPAREEWLKGWTGVVIRLTEMGEDSDPRAGDIGYTTGRTSDRGELVETAAWQSGSRRRWPAISWLGIDPRRPEVRDRLVRCGAPAWARDIPAALWVWAMTGKVPRFVLREWDEAWSPRVDRWSAGPVNGACLSTMVPDARLELEDWLGWKFRAPADAPQSGPETGAIGRAHADLAALRARCILIEPDGCYVPLADGGIGWWAA